MTDLDLCRAAAERLDAADPLAGFRDRFVIAEPDLIYLDGNSLGRLPAATPAALDAVVRGAWGTGLVRSWQDWIDWGSRIGDRLAAHVLGAEPGEVVLADSTSVNLYKLASAALHANPGNRTVVVDAEDFPTNRYVLAGLGADVRTLVSDIDHGPDLVALRAAMDGAALVVLSLVGYRSGALLDMAAVNAAARDAGALVLWDLSHAAGAIPIDLAATGADLAVGCTYKYLNGGPGSPAFLYVRHGLQQRLRQPIQGWFGQRDQFAMGQDYDPADGIERFLVGAPPILSLAAVDPALTLIAEAGVDRVRAKGRQLGDLIVQLAPPGFRLASPADPERRGSHVSLEHPEAWRICRALAEDEGVVCDFRTPDRLRIGPAPIYTTYTEVWDAMDRLRRLAERRGWEHVPPEKPRVT